MSLIFDGPRISKSITAYPCCTQKRAREHSERGNQISLFILNYAMSLKGTSSNHFEEDSFSLRYWDYLSSYDTLTIAKHKQFKLTSLKFTLQIYLNETNKQNLLNRKSEQMEHHKSNDLLTAMMVTD